MRADSQFLPCQSLDAMDCAVEAVRTRRTIFCSVHARVAHAKCELQTFAVTSKCACSLSPLHRYADLRVGIAIGGGVVGAQGAKARKPRHRLSRVSKFQDSNSIPLAGLVGSSGVGSAPGKGQGPPQERQPVGRVGSFFLRCLGRRPREHALNSEETAE